MPKTVWKCVNCSLEYTKEEYLCPQCSSANTQDKPPQGILLGNYNYEAIINSYPKGDLFGKLKQNGFLDILPLKSLQSLSGLAVGNTPLYGYKIKKDSSPRHKLYLKDDSQNPTFSFKDRASDLVSASAREAGINRIITASTGNAGSSMAGIGAAQNQEIIILVPQDAPKAKLLQAAMYGARIIPVNGSYDEAFDLAVEATTRWGIYNRNTAYNPITIEGKKIASLEIFDQLNERVPDTIFVPVGDGCILSGIYKGWVDLLKLDLVKMLPQIILVQAKGSQNLIANLDGREFSSTPPDTFADSISVKIPRSFEAASYFWKNYGGSYTVVSDANIYDAARELASRYGIFSEPAAAAAYAGYQQYLQKGKITADSENVVLLTGSGLKDTGSYQKKLILPEAVNPKIEELEKLLSP